MTQEQLEQVLDGLVAASSYVEQYDLDQELSERAARLYQDIAKESLDEHWENYE